jgi:hypothetical protein
MGKNIRTAKELFNECVEQFPFNEAEEVMRKMNWGYHYTSRPTIDDFKSVVEDLFQNASEGVLDKKIVPDSPYFSSSGRFKVSVSKDRFNKINWVQISFIPFECDEYD